MAFDEDGNWIPEKPKRKRSKKRKRSSKKKKTATASSSASTTKDTPKQEVPAKRKAPAVVTQSKTVDVSSRFRDLLPDIGGLTDQIIEADFDYSKAIEVTTRADDLVDWAPNAISWCADRRFLGMSPYAKQAEVLLSLFEEYCPRCSEPDYVTDIPVGDSVETVMSKVAMLEFGKCPHCSYTKGQGRTDGIIKDPNELVAVIGQRSGKCVDGQTEIMANGERRTVGSLVDETFVVVTKTKNNRIAYAEATAFESGEKACIELTVSHGGSVILSTDHRVFTPDGWVEAGHLSEGDLVAAPRAIPEPPRPLLVSDDEVIMAAYLLSDGNVTGTSCRLTNETPEVVADFTAVGDRLADGSRSNSWRRRLSDEQVKEAQRLAELGWSQTRIADRFGVSQPCVSTSLSRRDKDYVEGVVKENDDGISYRARGLTWLKETWGLRGRATEKRVPAKFYGLSNRHLALFLNRFWACDGYVDKGGVGITLASEKMIDDLQWMLLRLGVRASKRYKLSKCQTGEFDSWRLECSGFDALNFIERVKPILGKEQRCLELVRALTSRKQPKSLTDPVPVSRKELREIADEIHAKTGVRCRSVIREFTSAKDSSVLSRQMFEKMCAEFGYDGSYRWLADTELRWQRVRSVEPRGVRKVYDLSVPETECFIASGMVLHNSALTAMATSYLIHRNLMLPLPWKEYGLTPGQMLDFTFVATKKEQSEKTLWATFKGMFESSPWFKSYKQVSDEEGKKAGIPVTVKSLETYMSFGHKRLLIYFAANDPSGLRGSTRFGFAIDELAWFGSKEGGIRANGPETYAALSNACMTLRIGLEKQLKKNPDCNWPPPLGLNVSSPRSMDDPLMSLYRDSAKSPRAVRRHWATWEAHPEMTFKLLTDIGETAKPTFARDFGAQPPLADDPLVPRIEIITEAFRNPLANEQRYGPVIRPTIQGHVFTKEMAVGVRTAKFLTAGLPDEMERPTWNELKTLEGKDVEELGPLKDTLDDITQRPLHQRMHIMGVDLGVTNNALAIVCGCLIKGGKFVTDFALEIKPRDSKTVNIADVYDNLIVPLVEKLNVVAVYYDTWSSLHQIQDLAQRFGSLGPLNDKNARRSWLYRLAREDKRPAFIADQYSLNMADALMLISRMEQGDCLFPAMEVPFMDLMVNQQLDATKYPFTHLATQMATVRARGSRLLKPANRDDDLFRAWCNAAVPAFTDDLVTDLLAQESRAEPNKKTGGVSFHVALGQGGKGIRTVENLGGGATSNSGTEDFPIVSRKGTFRG